MEDNAAQPGQPVDPNEALARLQQLEEETKRLREQLQASQVAQSPEVRTNPAVPAAKIVTPQPSQAASPTFSAPAGTPASVEKAEEPVPPPPTDSQKEEADRLLQRYRLEKQRGNKEFAAKYLAEAVALAPGYSYVIECRGDEALDNRRTEEAKRLYKLAKTVDPKNHSADTKHANLVFRSEAAPASAMANVQEITASAKIASILSAFLPGLGQIVTQQYFKGGFIILLWVGLVIISPAGFKSLTALATGRGEVVAGPLVALAIMLFVYIGNLVDMSAYMKGAAARNALMGIAEKKDRPAPPKEAGNLPFE